MGVIILLVVAILCLIGGIVQIIASFFGVGLVIAWPGFITMFALMYAWYMVGLPLLCISPSAYTTIAGCLIMIMWVFGAGLLPFPLVFISGVIALIVEGVIFIIGGLATLVTTIISPCLPKIWLQWPFRFLFGGLRLVMA